MKNISKINQKKLNLTFLIIVIIQIFLLINLPTANSYLISKDSPSLDQQKIQGKKIFLKLLKQFLSIKQIGLVSATNTHCCTETEEGQFCKEVPSNYRKCKGSMNLGSCAYNGCHVLNMVDAYIPPATNIDAEFQCCPEMKDGAICQDILTQDTDFCKTTPIPTNCESTSFCVEGCCIDEEEGLCTPNSPQQKCLSDKGKWVNNKQCNIIECKRGCCVLGGDTEFSTEQRCNQLSLMYGFELDFRNINTEIGCLALSATQKKGACINNNVCKIKTESECLSGNGKFYPDYLCSHTDLNTSCEKQSYIDCLEGKDEIYWFDSCGNAENIYSSDKDSSWNNGKILTKDQSCNSDSANINSETCGNCNRFVGSVCSFSSSPKVNDGNFICKDLGCDENNDGITERKNGESWCVYDSYIGEGKDTPGSRHWLRKCVEGEIKIEPCADYRGELCTQQVIEDSGKTFSTAACVLNEGIACVNYNDEEPADMEKLCNENKHCEIKHIAIADNFQFDMCTPQYPKGFDFSDTTGINQKVCAIASQTCTVIYVKEIDGDWECDTNCECESSEFARQMNDLCISLGDCGTYVNYIGKGTTNTQVNGGENAKTSDFAKYANFISGQFVPPQAIEKTLKTIFGNTINPDSLTMLGQILGGAGSLILMAGTEGLGLLATATEVGAVTVAEGGAGVFVPAGTPIGLGAFAGAAIGAGLGMMAGAYLAKEFGIQDKTAATVMMAAGGVLGAALGISYMATGSLTAGLSTAFSGFAGLGTMLGPLTATGWGAVIAVAVMVYMAIVGWGEVKEVPIEFKCLPWQPPTGGDDCTKCNDDPLKPCSKYRCESLGQACKLLNENTESPICEAIAFEPNPPIITPGKIINGSVEFKNENTKSVNLASTEEECIPEFTPIIFTLDTDEPAQCKYDFVPSTTYENMSRFPLEGTIYSKEHAHFLKTPSIESLELNNITGDHREWFADAHMYVRCQDYHGNFNLDSYVIDFCINSGPDITPPRILHSTPENNAFVKYGTTQKELTLYLNEPAECKYSINPEQDYETMENEFSCDTDFSSEKSVWTCNTILDLIPEENKFYLKCRDKPWVSTPENIEEYGERNTNNEDIIYTLELTSSELEISSISPSEKIEAGYEPFQISLNLATSGGAENGKATCYYEWAGNFIQFYPETGSNSHSQILNLQRGKYEIPIKCEDVAENTITKNTTFTIEIDNSPPTIVRAFKSGSSLQLVTDEEAKCYYDPYRCNFKAENSTSMTTAYSSSHSTEWKPGTTYYVKCEDIWGNKNSGCAMIIKPGIIK